MRDRGAADPDVGSDDHGAGALVDDHPGGRVDVAWKTTIFRAPESDPEPLLPARCRAVTRIPYDPHLEEGAEVDLGELSGPSRAALLELAACVADAFPRDRRPEA